MKFVAFGINPLRVICRYGKKATRPCPCAYRGHFSSKCHCTLEQVARYRRRISGPLLDRIDLHSEVPALPPEDLAAKPLGQSSHEIRNRVVGARARQIERQGYCNALLTPAQIENLASVEAGGLELLKHAIARLTLSARGYQRILKVARTIADLTAGARISTQQVAEAIQLCRGEVS